MNRQGTQEIPLVFDCEGSPLVGILHRPASPMSVGIVAVIAGGPQYRAGVGRNMVSMARELSASGAAVLRFDHRGLGDSGGRFLGFEHIGPDLQAAVDTLRREVPEVRQVVLWGGCDAASGAMIHGWRVKGVASMVLGNPWVTTTESQSAVQREHYLRRLREWSFWRKVLSLRYNPLDYLRSAWRGLRSRMGSRGEAGVQGEAVAGNSNWIERMRQGLERFEGPVLFLMSGQSMVSREFDDIVGRDSAWQRVYHRPHYRRIDVPDADQTFSGGDSRERVNRALREWLASLESSQGSRGA